AAQEHAMTSALADARARERIQTDLGATLVVEAAAGTGKTTELVARIVALVRTGRTTLDRILSVTFTDLAAGEMKRRLRSELEEARAAATVEERDRLTAALERLEAAPIGTIHSFCAALLRERPVEARVDPVFEVAAGEEQDRLFDQAFDGWFQRVIASPPEGVRRLLRRKVRPGDRPPRELLRQAGRDLSEHRDFSGPWRRERFDREAGLEQQIARLAELGELAQRAQRPTTGRRNRSPASPAGSPSCGAAKACALATATDSRRSCTSSAAGASGTGAAAENGSPGIWKRRRCLRSATRSRPSCRHFSTAPI